MYTDQEIRQKALQLESAGAPSTDIEEFVSRAKGEQTQQAQEQPKTFLDRLYTPAPKTAPLAMLEAIKGGAKAGINIAKGAAELPGQIIEGTYGKLPSFVKSIVKAANPVLDLTAQGLVGAKKISSLVPEQKSSNLTQQAGYAGGMVGPIVESLPSLVKSVPKIISLLKGSAGEAVKNSIKLDVQAMLKATRSIGNKTAQAGQKGTNLEPILSDPQVFKGIKVEKGKINPDEAIATVQSRTDKLLDAKHQMLPVIDSIVPKISRERVYEEAIANIGGRPTPADLEEIKLAIAKQVDALPEFMAPSEVDAFRAQARVSARRASGLMKSQNEYAALENGARKIVFDVTDNLPVPNAGEYKAMNDYIKQMIETENFLNNTLRNQVVKGGRLGGYALRTVGAIAGAGHGVLGSIAGSEIGGVVADIMQNTQLGNSLKMSLIRGLTDEPAILKEAEKLLGGIKGVDVLKRPALGPGAINLPGRPDTSGVIRNPRLDQLPQYPPLFTPARMLPAGRPDQSTINQGRAILVHPRGASREYVGPDVSVGGYKKLPQLRPKGEGQASLPKSVIDSGEEEAVKRFIGNNFAKDEKGYFEYRNGVRADLTSEELKYWEDFARKEYQALPKLRQKGGTPNPKVQTEVQGKNALIPSLIKRNNELRTEIKNNGEIVLRKITSKDAAHFDTIGKHTVLEGKPIVMDNGSLYHYDNYTKLPPELKKQKTRHLEPSETERVVMDYDDVFPNSLKGSENSYFLVKLKPTERLSIVEVIDEGNKIRITNGGFETPKGKYYKKEKVLKKSILEGRQ